MTWFTQRNLSHSFMWNIVTFFSMLASVAQLDAPSDWRPGGHGFNPHRGRQHSFVEIDREIFSTVILSFPLIQERQLSVSGERMCTILVNRLENKACTANMWLGKLTALDITPLGWLGRKTSTQTKLSFQKLDTSSRSKLVYMNSYWKRLLLKERIFPLGSKFATLKGKNLLPLGANSFLYE